MYTRTVTNWRDSDRNKERQRNKDTDEMLLFLWRHSRHNILVNGVRLHTSLILRMFSNKTTFTNNIIINLSIVETNFVN